MSIFKRDSTCKKILAPNVWSTPLFSMFHILFQVFIYCVLALPPVGTIQTGCEIIPEHGHQRLFGNILCRACQPAWHSWNYWQYGILIFNSGLTWWWLNSRKASSLMFPSFGIYNLTKVVDISVRPAVLTSHDTSRTLSSLGSLTRGEL